MDFCSVPTITFSVLYVFFVIDHDRRRILPINTARHPSSDWIVQQLREAFPYQPTIKFLILDHDAKYGTEVSAAIRSMEITAVRTTVGCPWQNGVAERWAGSRRCELLDHVIAINESHQRRLLSPYLNYYHQDRTHCGLEKADSRKANALCWTRKRHRVPAAWRASSSLRTRRLIQPSLWFRFAATMRLLIAPIYWVGTFGLDDSIFLTSANHAQSRRNYSEKIAAAESRLAFWRTTGVEGYRVHGDCVFFPGPSRPTERLKHQPDTENPNVHPA